MASGPAQAILQLATSPAATPASGLPARQSAKHVTMLSQSFSAPVKHAVVESQQLLPRHASQAAEPKVTCCKMGQVAPSLPSAVVLVSGS
jgi:hypothetical protein